MNKNEITEMTTALTALEAKHAELELAYNQQSSDMSDVVDSYADLEDVLKVVERYKAAIDKFATHVIKVIRDEKKLGFLMFLGLFKPVKELVEDIRLIIVDNQPIEVPEDMEVLIKELYL